MCILRSFITKVMDDTMVVAYLKKKHIWVPLQWLVTFTRISGGREDPHGAWRMGYRRTLCRVVPWFLRVSILIATWPATRHLPSSYHTMPQHPRETACASFTGFPVPCDELRRVREFNENVMPSMRALGVRRVREAMNEHGFAGHIWHVGHACPDPSKKSTQDLELVCAACGGQQQPWTLPRELC